MRTAIKKVGKAIETGEAGAAVAAYREGASAVDTMATKGLIHGNKAARHKSRLNKALKLVQKTPPTTTPKATAPKATAQKSKSRTKG